MVKLNVYTDENKLNQIFQSNAIEFMFVNETGENEFSGIHPYVKCREYFNELLMVNHHPDKFKFVPTYGFYYKHDVYPLDLSATRIALNFPGKEKLRTFVRNLPLLHQIEEHHNLTKTEVLNVDDYTVIIVADKFWVQKCILTNIYTWLLKLMSINIQKGYSEVKKEFGSTTEVEYLAQLSVKNANAILENLNIFSETKTKYVDLFDTLRHCGTVHACSGIMQAYCNQSSCESLCLAMRKALSQEVKYNWIGK